MNIAGTLICGQVNGETAKWVSARFHKADYLKTTVSTNSSDTSISKAEQQEETITPATLANLSSGEFVGLVADDPDAKIEQKGFHATLIKKWVEPISQRPLPVVRTVTDDLVQSNFMRIVSETESLVKQEMNRILTDPSLKQYIVRR